MRSHADIEQEIIDAIYRGACDHAELEKATQLIAGCFRRCGVFFGELDLLTPEAQFSISTGTIDEAFARDYAAVAAIDPAPERFAALGIGKATTTNRMFSQDFLRRSVFLNEFLRPRAIESTLATPLLSSAGRFAIMGIHQGTAEAAFEDHDILRLERLAPHLTRALQIRRLFLQSEMRGQALEALLDRKVAGVIGLSGSGATLFVNKAARMIAADRDGIGLDRSGRPSLAGEAGRRLAQLESEVARGESGGVMRVRRPSGKAAYLVLVAPLPASESVLHRSKKRGILFAIHDPARRLVTSVQRIATLLRLPPGAAKIVAAILEGVELKDYAERENISINTVKFHLKTAFDRTDTRSQAALVRHALLALTDLGPHFADP